MLEDTQLKNPDFPSPPAEFIKAENIPKLNSLCQKVVLLLWVWNESCAAELHSGVPAGLLHALDTEE